MVLDTSALLAILFAEPEAGAMVSAIGKDGVRILGAPTLVEASAVMVALKGPAGEVALDAVLQRLGIKVVDMGVDAARLARLAYARCGKGVGEPGVLNFGDCLTYGIATAARAPLLFKGDDFARTDVEIAAY